MNYLITFSPTGGTRKAAEQLCLGIDDRFNLIELCVPSQEVRTPELSENDMVVVAAPVYGGRIPALAAERITSMKGNGSRCAVMVVYGNRAYDDALTELKDIMLQAGFNVIAAVSAIAEHSIVRDYAAGRPDIQDADKLQEFGKKIRLAIRDGHVSHDVNIPGKHLYKKAGAGPVPSAGKGCVECGICAQGCPVGAISATDLKHSDKSKCISCMKCVSACPSGARHINPVMHFMVKTMLRKPCRDRKEVELFL